jgi:8-amino-7-oxononanoate synthase
MGIFDKFANLTDRYAELRKLGRDPFAVQIEKIVSATQAIIEGREVLLAGTNNYLGLTFNDQCVEAASEAVLQQGTGTTGSRVANGTYATHSRLEQRLAEFLDSRSAIVFSTGYQANLGTIAGLAGPDDYVLIDADCHASIYDACRLCGATIIRFRHNSPTDLNKRLSRLDPAANKLIAVEGLYSMLGDIAPLADFVKVKDAHENAYLIVDEAHSLGVFGDTGKGVAEDAGVLKGVDFIVGTFSKSLGSIGGFCVSDHPEFDMMRVSSRPYMFTASLAPSNAATALAALQEIDANPELRTTLWRNARKLHEGIAAVGLSLGAAPSPVVAVKMPSIEVAAYAWNLMLDQGVYVNLAIPPGTPNSLSLLRVSVSAAHSDEQIDFIIKAFDQVARELGVHPDQQRGLKVSAGD